ncbi:MAG: N-acetylornithine carbamoyltransferase [Phycisphaerales bacterium]
MNRFLDLNDLDDAALASVIARATALHRQPLDTTLAGRVIGLVFMNPSLRTLASFQAGIAQLGGSSFTITPGASSWALEWADGTVMDGAAGEHIREAIPVLEEYADLLGVRCFAGGDDLASTLADPILSLIGSLARKPLINMESAVRHPCQALADWKTLDDLGVPANSSGRFVLSWTHHPKALPLAVPASVLAMACRRGMDVTLACPADYVLPEPIMDAATRDAAARGGSLTVTADRAAAMDGAHVLYAKSWAAPGAWGDADAEAALRAQHADWTVDESWFAPAAPGARFMHCLPVRRNVVVADAVLDGPRSAVVAQAGNRMHAQKALLEHLLPASAGASVPTITTTPPANAPCTPQPALP